MGKGKKTPENLDQLGNMIHALGDWLTKIDAELTTLNKLVEKMAEFEGIDHERLTRVESMVMFVMQKKGLTLNRMPLPGEIVKGKSSRVLYSKSWYEEWLEGWEKKKVEHDAKGAEERTVETEVEPADGEE